MPVDIRLVSIIFEPSETKLTVKYFAVTDPVDKVPTDLKPVPKVMVLAVVPLDKKIIAAV